MHNIIGRSFHEHPLTLVFQHFRRPSETDICACTMDILTCGRSICKCKSQVRDQDLLIFLRQSAASRIKAMRDRTEQGISPGGL